MIGATHRVWKFKDDHRVCASVRNGGTTAISS
uniref:Uncharacterized protein n=1 Tax=Siphoviridae sp. ctOCb13 TaxID=2825477 RepID=A0A8S5Q2D7_9CAUD|nr:MAG TPA: hypothetical protein [Siphoviridae sp. ctOCb13]